MANIFTNLQPPVLGTYSQQYETGCGTDLPVFADPGGQQSVCVQKLRDAVVPRRWPFEHGQMGTVRDERELTVWHFGGEALVGRSRSKHIVFATEGQRRECYLIETVSHVELVTGQEVSAGDRLADGVHLSS